MAEQDDVSFPPVIVYTGRSLTRDEEQRLRRFSQLDHHQGRALAGAAARRGHAVPAPGRVRAAGRAPAHAARGARPRAALEGRRILVVEDDVRNIFALSSVLEPRGAQGRDRAQRPRGARGARAQLGRSRRRAIDLVLMDIMMPEMDGLTAMREIRKQPRVAEAADHRAHRQGDEATTRRSASRPAPTTTSPSRSTSRSCCRWCASGCRSNGAATRGRQRLRHRAAAAARGDLPASTTTTSAATRWPR